MVRHERRAIHNLHPNEVLSRLSRCSREAIAVICFFTLAMFSFPGCVQAATAWSAQGHRLDVIDPTGAMTVERSPALRPQGSES